MKKEKIIESSMESRRKMLSNRKRKHSTTKSPKTTAPQNPYPDHPRPTREECSSVRDDLLSLHGFPQEFIKYRNQRSQHTNDVVQCDEEEKESVLDGLVKTILSQNTTELNSERAFASLKTAFPNWEHVLEAESKCIEDAIRCGGLAPTKSSCVKNLLSCLLEKKGKLCMEYLKELSTEEIKAELSQFKGIGPKTVACVLMFHLQKDDFPVDTHVGTSFVCEATIMVFQIAKTMGWVPSDADIKKTYLHLNQRIPDELKFDLNCLIYTHGKVCKRCSNRKVGRQKLEIDVGGCPLLAYSKNCEVDD